MPAAATAVPAAGAEAADPAMPVIVFLDGDGADRGDLLGMIAGPVLAGTHDFVLASRTRGRAGPRRRCSGTRCWRGGSPAGGMGALYGVRYSDMCAFRAIGRDALRRLDMREMTYGWNIEMQMKAARLRLRIQEVPLPYRCRRAAVEGRRLAARHAARRPEDRVDLRAGGGTQSS